MSYAELNREIQAIWVTTDGRQEQIEMLVAVIACSLLLIWRGWGER